jgi:hypothetical protein
MSEKENIPEHDQHRAELIAEIEHQKQKLASGRQRLLPGIALIGIFMLVFGLVNGINVFQQHFPSMTMTYSVLAIYTMLIVGVFGMLGLRRWGWAMVLAAIVLCTAMYLLRGTQTHLTPYFMIALIFLFFFLYLVRPEVRERMR